MKEIKLYIGIIAVLLTTMLTACSDSMVDNDPSTTSETEEGYYKASFRIAIPSFEENATRSTVFLNEGIRNKEAMKLFCFDNKGQFVGFGKIQDFTPVLGYKRSAEGDYYEVDEYGNNKGNILDHKPGAGICGGDIKLDGNTDPKEFSAMIPNNTSHIHLVANTDDVYQTINERDQWKWAGMHENLLMTTFQTHHTESQHVQTRYWGYINKKNPEELKKYLRKDNLKDDYIIHLIRDRAKISAEWSEDAIENAKKENRTLENDFKLTVINGVAYGTLAPFDRNNLAFTPTTGNSEWVWNVDYVTPPLDGSRLAGDATQMYNPTGVYEDTNLPSAPSKVLMLHNGKYYLIYLQDASNKPYHIKRNYEYKIIIDKLDDCWGYGNLQEALKSAPVNNPWITIQQIMPGVSNGDEELKIEDGTYQFVHSGEGTQQTISFTYKGNDAASKQASDFKAIWTENLAYAEDAQPVVASYSYNSNTQTGTGTITYKLGIVDDNWREGTIHLYDTKKHGLSINIHLYSINEVQYQVNAPANIGTNANAEAEFKFTVPANYPKELLPVTVKFASGDVVPEGCDIEYSSTSEINKTWDSWHVFKADKAGTTYTVKLKNIRQANAGTSGSYYVKMDNANQGNAKNYTFTYK